MRETVRNMEDKVWKLRTWIYIIGILAFCIAVIYHCNRGNAVESECNTGEDYYEDTDNNFWPPDMIPHPTCPGDGPEKKEPVMS
jgi:hypothetical protein